MQNCAIFLISNVVEKMMDTLTKHIQSNDYETNTKHYKHNKGYDGAEPAFCIYLFTYNQI